MIPQMIPFFDEIEAQMVAEYMKSGGFITEFKKTLEFENLISEFTGSPNAIIVNNGTVSLYLMMLALEIGHGDEVIVPNYTMIATPNSVLATGASPIFVDVEPNTLCIDFEALENRLSPKTKAVIFVSANGRFPSYGIETLVEWCGDRNLYLLEDAAQGLGSIYPNGAHIGTVGLMGSLSFSVPKIISTGQGGCILTASDPLAAKLRRLKDFGRSSGGIDVHDSIGFNFKFTDLQACVGIAQMGKLESRIIRKREIWEKYNFLLKDVPNIQLFSHDTKFTTPWFIDSLAENRESLVAFLKNRGIGTRTMYPPIHSQKAYGRKGSFPISEEIGRVGLWLPSFVQITDSEINEVCSSIAEFYG